MPVKFIAEMNPSEMENSVFGVGFKRDQNGNPIEQGLCSDEHIRTGENLGPILQHLKAIRQFGGDQGAERQAREIDRVNSIRRSAGLPPLALPHDF